MEETLVSYTTAVLAKDKGFNLRTESLYRSATKIIGSIHGYDFDIAAPTQTALQKWLRDNHKVCVNVLPIDSQWYFLLTRANETLTLNRTRKAYYKSYEVALGEGLREALEVIAK